jgi:hypothetical protein
VALVHVLLTHEGVQKAAEQGKKILKRVLILTPAITVDNWEAEFDKWTKGLQIGVPAYASQARQQKTRAKAIDRWNKEGGVLILSYDLFKDLCQKCDCIAKGKLCASSCPKYKEARIRRQLLQGYYTHTCIYTYVNSYVHSWLSTHTHTHKDTHTHTRTHTHTHTHTIARTNSQ